MDRQDLTDNERVIRSAFDYWMSGDMDSYFGLFAEDAELVEPASLPYGGSCKGLAAIKAGLHEMVSAWKDASVEMKAMTSGGDYVITLLDFAGTGVATGVRVSYEIAEVFRVTNGKITRIKPIYADTAAALTALVK